MIRKTDFKIPKMDCPSEERIIRLKLSGEESIKKLDFDIQARMLTIYHETNPKYLLNRLIPLNFGAEIISTSSLDANSSVFDDSDPIKEAKVLKLLFAINFVMFFLELITGYFADSIGLVSDSLDMLADASVYLISLFAVGKTNLIKNRSARINGYFQLLLGLGVLTETLRRFFYGSEPQPSYMIFVSLLALAANVYCLLLLSKHKEKGVHMKASYICSSTDVIANIGVVIAGALVFLTNSAYPDLIIGLIITTIVLRGSFAILNLSK